MTAGQARGSHVDDSEVDKPPLYARVLRLKHIRPGPWWCFLFFEGSLAVAGVLVLADWVSPWGLLVLPVGVALAVKLNDVVTGALPPSAAANSGTRTGSGTNAGSKRTAKTDSTAKPDGKSETHSKSKTEGSSADDKAASTSTTPVEGGSAAAAAFHRKADTGVATGETELDETGKTQNAEGATAGDAGSTESGAVGTRSATSGPARAEAAATSALATSDSEDDSGSGSSLFDLTTARDKDAADQAGAARLADDQAAQDLFTRNAERRVAEARAGDDNRDDRANDKLSDGNATDDSRGKSDRGSRGRRGVLRATTARSRRIAGGKTTAPTPSGSTPAKDEG